MNGHIAILTGVVTLAAGITACSSSTTTTSNSANSSRTGIEAIYGKITGPAAMSSNPVFNLTFKGPVNTTGTTTLGGQPKKGATHTFTTGVGNLVVTLQSSGISKQGMKDVGTCLFASATTVPFTVDGAASTGRFIDASGTGDAVVTFTGNLPKLSSGQCNESQNAQPKTSTAAGIFAAAAKLTVRG